MKVCIVQPNRSSATETFLRSHAEDLPGQVEVIYGARPRPARRQLQGRANRVRFCIKVLGLLKGKSKQWVAHRLVSDLFQWIRPEVVLAEYGPTGVTVMQACQQLRIPLVVHFHGYDASHVETLTAHRESYPRMFQLSAACIVVSRTMRNQLLSLGASTEKLALNPCGVDCRRFAGANPQTAPPVLLAVGRLIEKKAPHNTITAFAQVLRRVPEARLRIVGDGSLKVFCEELTVRLGIDHAVTFLGECEHAIVQQEMQAARVFVQHSVVAPCGDSEGTPVAVLEASASGLPVIATRHGGLTDVVVDGKTGFLVEEHDVTAMARQMHRLVVDPQLAARMGLSGCRRVMAKFSRERSIERLSSILEACAAGRELGTDPTVEELAA